MIRKIEVPYINPEWHNPERKNPYQNVFIRKRNPKTKLSEAMRAKLSEVWRLS